MPLAAPNFDLSGRRALITGSSRGIGLAIAEALAAAGAEIVLNGRNQEVLGATAERLAREGARVKAVAFDVTDEEGVTEGVAWCEAELGPIDILVNNAGIQYRSPLEDFPTEMFETVIATNLTSVFFVGRAVARHMLKRGHGRIINICSALTQLARTSVAPYGASKAAVANLTRGMATDWGPKGLNVNAIAPGYILTEMNEALLDNAEFNAWVEGRTPMRRWGRPDEIGGAAVFLASDAASFVNGHILYVDGAFTATV
jgi:gluconate 5-dehydrogenase